jgi:ankyrin repeat protein
VSSLHQLIAEGRKDAFLAALGEIPAPQLAAALNKPSDNQEQATVLHQAVLAGWADIVPMLVEKGANPHIKTFYEVDALYLAVARNDLETAKALLDSGANANTRRFDDQITALQLAIEEKHIPMMELLLQYGADPGLRTPPKDKGQNAFHYAAKTNVEVMTALLKQPGAAAVHEIAAAGGRSISALRVALERGDREMAEKLLDYGVSVNETDDNGETPLFYLLAHRPGREEALPLIRLLLHRGADVDKVKNFWDETPLFPAVRESFTEAVALLLALGLDPKQKSQLQETPLHLAAEKWDEKTVKLLVAAGANVNALNRIKRTPLHVAAHANRLKVVEALLEAGADPFLKDHNGKTPRDLAPAEYQRSVNRALDRKEQEIEIRRDGYSAYWNKKAKEPEKKEPRPYRRPNHNSHGFRRGR